MWNVQPDRDKSSGGFQDRDLGKTQFDRDYGPEYGVDYARFSDPPDFKKDYLLKTHVEEQIALDDRYRNQDITLTIRNGFIILKGKVDPTINRTELADFLRSIPGVVEVINQIADN